MIDLIDSRCSTHGLLLCFILLHISNSLVSTSLVGHVLYSADLMSTTCIPHFHLMVHKYIYSRYSFVFLMLYQLYHSLSFSTLILSSSLYLSIATWVTPQGYNSHLSSTGSRVQVCYPSKLAHSKVDLECSPLVTFLVTQCQFILIVSWLGKIAKLFFIFLFVLFCFI